MKHFRNAISIAVALSFVFNPCLAQAASSSPSTPPSQVQGASIFPPNSSGAPQSVQSFTDNCKREELNGFDDAKRRGSGAFVAYGFVGGFLLGLIGAGLVWAIANGGNPTPSMTNMPADRDLSRCYERGYFLQAKEEDKNGACMGGILGTLAIVLIVVASQGGGK